MNSQLRRMERRLTLERAQVQCAQLTGQLIERWTWAAANGQPLPDPLQFIRRVTLSGFYLPSGAQAANYLDDCRRDCRIPEESRLLRILLPWAFP